MSKSYIYEVSHFNTTRKVLFSECYLAERYAGQLFGHTCRVEWLGGSARITTEKDATKTTVGWIAQRILHTTLTSTGEID